MDKSTLDKIKAGLICLWEKFEIDNDYLDSENNEWIEEFDQDELTVDFPDDQSHILYSVSDFLDYMSDINTFEIVSNSTARTSHIRQTVITSEYGNYELFEDILSSYEFVGDGYVIRIIKYPFLIGLMNTKTGNSDDNYGVGSCDLYLAIEIKYTGETRLSVEDEDDQIARILYYISSQVGAAVYVSDVIDVQGIYDQEIEEDDEVEKHTINVKDIPQYSALMNLYIQAEKAKDPEIKFLQFYKVIEYISPVVAKLAAYERLNKRLDILSSVNRDYHYLDSLLEIAHKYDEDVKDDYLAICVMQNCVDVVPLWDYLPERFKKQIKNNLKLTKDTLSDSDLDEPGLRSLQKQIANIIYSTRNSIVHAKSNYQPNGLELSEEEMPDGNEMMNIIAKSIICWDLRQPDGLRV